MPLTSACSFVPPYVLERLAAGSDPAVAERARESLRVDRELRARRRGLPSATGEPGDQGTAPAPAPSPRAAGTGPQRTISDARQTQELPGTKVRGEGEPATADPAADEAYDGLGATWDLWSAAFERDSLDGKGLPLLATVHFGRQYDNAFWDGSQMVFGDGDGVIFERFTKSLEVIGHELCHGVTEYTAGLVYQGQSGALNESVSDVFGALVKQRLLGQSADQADWLVGADVLAPGVAGRALRDMRNPGTAYDDPRLGKDPQPAHMDQYVDTTDDNGGVHINSGIPNRAFVLAALAMGGNAWEDAGAIWYAVLTGDGIKADCDFATFVDLTLRAAAERHGDGSAQYAAVRDGWAGVGLIAAGSDGEPEGSGAPGGGAGRADGADGWGDGPGDGSGPDTGENPPSGEAHGEVPGADATLLLKRTGGFAGLVRQRELMLADLSDRDARDWRHLLTAPTLQRIAATTDRPVPDAFCYSVVCAQVDLDVTVAEPHLPEAIHDLFERTLRLD